MKKKAFFIIFNGLSIKQLTHFFLEGESPTLRLFLFQKDQYLFNSQSSFTSQKRVLNKNNVNKKKKGYSKILRQKSRDTSIAGDL